MKVVKNISSYTGFAILFFLLFWCVVSISGSVM